ncbi:TIR domain-containing protein [Sodalis sp. RH24]|uniref:TIR domain-containing protein n=1 Tax=unclassified Sodalis (in: enterobacteria) TaxID=2636512 RepID=UPI0039B43624
MTKPRIFVASSKENLDVANAVIFNLDHHFQVTSWSTSTFNLSSNALDDLIIKASNVDFAVFIFSPEDISMMREHEKRVVRDNVLFEFGLFIGKLGKERCYILKPRNKELHLPTDLIGLNTEDYDEERTDNDIRSATIKACSSFQEAASRLGAYINTAQDNQILTSAGVRKYNILQEDIKVLLGCLQSVTSKPEGLTVHEIKDYVKMKDDTQLHVPLIKLERMRLLEKSIQISNYNGEEYYSYAITEEGIEYILNNYKGNKQSDINLQNNPPDNFDEDIPF